MVLQGRRNLEKIQKTKVGLGSAIVLSAVPLQALHQLQSSRPHVIEAFCELNILAFNSCIKQNGVRSRLWTSSPSPSLSTENNGNQDTDFPEQRQIERSALDSRHVAVHKDFSSTQHLRSLVHDKCLHIIHLAFELACLSSRGEIGKGYMAVSFSFASKTQGNTLLRVMPTLTGHSILTQSLTYPMIVYVAIFLTFFLAEKTLTFYLAFFLASIYRHAIWHFILQFISHSTWHSI